MNEHQEARAASHGYRLDIQRFDSMLKGEVYYSYQLVLSRIEASLQRPVCTKRVDLPYSKRRDLIESIGEIPNPELLKQIGKELAKVFIKGDIENSLTLLLNESDHSFVEITSVDFELPWHLLFLEDSERFLSLEVPFGFKPYGGRMNANVAQRDIGRALVISDPTHDARLKHVAKETETILSILEHADIEVECLPNDRRPVVSSREFEQLIETGEFDLIHFAGHGDSMGNKAWLYFSEMDRFYASQLDHIAVRNSPLVFLNACSSGVPSELSLLSLLEVVGTFAPKVFLGGARGFIGGWSQLGDECAKDFAIEFYRRFILDGVPLGEAVLGARRKILNGHCDPRCQGAWATYVFYGDCLGRAKRSAQQIPLRSQAGETGAINRFSESFEILAQSANCGIQWILDARESWIRDIHLAVQAFKAMSLFGPRLINSIDEEDRAWFRERINNLYTNWLQDRKMEALDVGICYPQCNAFPGCNLFPVINYAEGFLEQRILIECIRKLTNHRHGELWFFSEADGFDRETPHVSASVLSFLASQRALIEQEGIVGNFKSVFHDSAITLIRLQSRDGSFGHPVDLRGCMPWEDKYVGHTMNDMFPIIRFLRNAKEFLPEIAEEIDSSLRRAGEYLQDRQVNGHWSCIAHCEDRRLYPDSNIRGTAYGIRSLLACGAQPYQGTVLTALRWLLSNQLASGAWPLDTRIRDVPRVSSTTHALSALHTWSKAIDSAFSFAERP